MDLVEWMGFDPGPTGIADLSVISNSLDEVFVLCQAA